MWNNWVVQLGHVFTSLYLCYQRLTEVMFSPLPVCLFVCLSVCGPDIYLKKLCMKLGGHNGCVIRANCFEDLDLDSDLRIIYLFIYLL